MQMARRKKKQKNIKIYVKLGEKLDKEKSSYRIISEIRCIRKE
jgi:hypothetical protein